MPSRLEVVCRVAFRHSLSQCVRRAWTCPVAGKSVLDAGAANGFFALLAALRGAERARPSCPPPATLSAEPH